MFVTSVKSHSHVTFILMVLSAGFTRAVSQQLFTSCKLTYQLIDQPGGFMNVSVDLSVRGVAIFTLNHPQKLLHWQFTQMSR